MEYVQAKDTFGVKIHFMYNDYLYYSFRNNWGWSYNHDHLLPNLAGEDWGEKYCVIMGWSVPVYKRTMAEALNVLKLNGKFPINEEEALYLLLNG